MLCPSEVLRSTRPSAALANVVHEPSHLYNHKNFTNRRLFLICWEAIGQQEDSKCKKKINAFLKIHPCDGVKNLHLYLYMICIGKSRQKGIVTMKS